MASCMLSFVRMVCVGAALLACHYGQAVGPDDEPLVESLPAMREGGDDPERQQLFQNIEALNDKINASPLSRDRKDVLLETSVAFSQEINRRLVITVVLREQEEELLAKNAALTKESERFSCQILGLAKLEKALVDVKKETAKQKSYTHKRRLTRCLTRCSKGHFRVTPKKQRPKIPFKRHVKDSQQA